AFPAHVKYSPPPDTSVDTVILNGCECEPFLTCDHRVMLEETEYIVSGLEAIMKACEAERGVIGVEDNKPDAYEALRRAVGDRPYEVVSLKTKYPEGAEKQLIDAITGREVPPGGLPLNIGVVVSNVSTAVAVARALKSGIPLIERVVTVSGDVIAEPKNLRVRLGTPYEVLLEACGGFTEPPARLISGGPMMGLAVYDLDIPVTKGTSGLVALSDGVSPILEEGPCIRCGRCVEACPSFLMPLYLATYPDESALEYRPLDCIECGCCTYVCPGNRHLLQRIRLAKAEATARQRAQS
ncbi:MAG: RnfABCDGE type electron transport complex subunit C, partial [Bacillota bacterium]